MKVPMVASWMVRCSSCQPVSPFLRGGRADWRTARIDRMHAPVPARNPLTPGPAPAGNWSTPQAIRFGTPGTWVDVENLTDRRCRLTMDTDSFRLADPHRRQPRRAVRGHQPTGIPAASAVRGQTNLRVHRARWNRNNDRSGTNDSRRTLTSPGERGAATLRVALRRRRCGCRRGPAT